MLVQQCVCWILTWARQIRCRSHLWLIQLSLTFLIKSALSGSDGLLTVSHGISFCLAWLLSVAWAACLVFGNQFYGCLLAICSGAVIAYGIFCWAGWYYPCGTVGTCYRLLHLSISLVWRDHSTARLVRLCDSGLVRATILSLSVSTCTVGLTLFLEFFAFIEGVAPTPLLPDLPSPPAILSVADPSCFFPVRFLFNGGADIVLLSASTTSLAGVPFTRLFVPVFL